MRILVLSDSHGDRWRLMQIVDAQPQAKIIFHLGDGAADAQALSESLPQGKFLYRVRGNCDLGSPLPLSVVDEIEGIRFYACHGHIEKVKYTDTVLFDRSREEKASVALYGHTHTPATNYVDGVYLFNPGCAHSGEYGVIDIQSGGILLQNMKLM